MLTKLNATTEYSRPGNNRRNNIPLVKLEEWCLCSFVWLSQMLNSFSNLQERSCLTWKLSKYGHEIADTLAPQTC